MRGKPQVILRRCPAYDPQAIARIIREGIEEFGLAPHLRGRVTIKPNVVFAHHKIAPSAFTRPEFLDGLLAALLACAPSGMKVSVAEKTGAALPSTRMLRRAGYYRLRRRHGFSLVPIEEAKKVRVPLLKGIVHESIRTAREIAHRDFLIYAPKLKTNVLAHGFTAALKLNIGILCDRERMHRHHYDLDQKIVDLLEVGYPDFIATDAVEIGAGGNQLTEHGRHLGAIVLATNPLAHDVVCAHILRHDPRAIGHLRAASERGYGSLELKDIEIRGDISLEELRKRTEGLEDGFIRVDDLACGFQVRSGSPYCVGGCHGVFLDWLYMIKDRKPRLWDRLPRWTVVIGEYEGAIQAARLLLIGTCTRVKGRVRARWKVRVRGCPPKHKTLVLMLLLKAGIVNPMFRPDLILDAYLFLFLSWLRRLVKGRL